jgi:hypothetical protein
MYQTFTKALLCLFCFFTIAGTNPGFSQAPTVFDVEISTDQYTILKSIALPGNKIAVLGWDNTYEVYLSVYDASGVRLSHTNISARIDWPHTYRYNVQFNAVSTADGNLFISYSINSNSAGMQTYNARYIVVKQNGDLVNSGQLNSVDAGGSYTWFVLLDRLSDGKIVAMWRRSANENYVFRLFNADGSAYNNDQAFAGAGTTTPMSTIYSVMLAAGRNGNFMVSIYSWNGAMRGFVFNNNGVTAAAGGALNFMVDDVAINSYGNYAICALANGNFLLAWNRSNIAYTKILSPDGSTVVATQALGSNYLQHFVPVYTPGEEGYVITENLARTPGANDDPYSTLVLKKYNQQAVLISSSSLSEGFLIRPTYQFFTGSVTGFGYLYSYYKSYTVMNMGGMPGMPGMPSMNIAMMQGDMDTKAALTGFPLSTLPIELLSFTATLRENNQALLKWSTSSESNNRYFEIGKSTDGISFTVIARIDGAGNSDDRKDYSYTDPQALTQKGFYRLRQVDIDGRLKDLGIKMLRPMGAQAKVSVYPNPLQGSIITLDAGAERLPVAWQLMDAGGRMLQSGKLTRQHEEVNTGTLRSGIYFIKIGNEVIKLRK